MGKKLHITAGTRYGRLVVVSEAERRTHGSARQAHRYFHCLCDCGKETEVWLGNLRAGYSQSCGCQSNRPATLINCHLLEYHSWSGMIQRCTNPNGGIRYINYGGRGISVCDRWLESFQAFLDDMGPRPSANHSIDRVDNDGNYEPDNCRWATPTEQCRNTRRNVMLTFDGETMCMTEWANRIGMSRAALHNRLKSGWLVDDALATPIQKQFRNKQGEGT